MTRRKIVAAPALLMVLCSSEGVTFGLAGSLAFTIGVVGDVDVWLIRQQACALTIQPIIEVASEIVEHGRAILIGGPYHGVMHNASHVDDVYAEVNVVDV